MRLQPTRGPAGDAGDVAGEAVRLPRINKINIPEKPRKTCKQLFPWWSGPQGIEKQLLQGWTNAVSLFRGGP